MKFNFICANTRVAILESLFKERYYENNFNVVKKTQNEVTKGGRKSISNLLCYI